MSYYAHSPKGSIPAQSYTTHVQGVSARAEESAQAVSPYASLDGDLLCKVVKSAAVFHDLGKLDKENQVVLSGEKSARALPINHVDAGTAYFLSDQQFSPCAAVLVQAHHVGLPDFIEEQNRAAHFRDTKIMAETDRTLSALEALHKSLAPYKLLPEQAGTPSGDMSVFLRIALSCLVDADHTDTAIHYGQYPQATEKIPLKPEERLSMLDAYVAGLKKDGSQRTSLREEMYTACRNTNITENICSCDSPVGSGKTTAVMAHLLAQAKNRNLRRIFVVLPFTNIISQSVITYRNALVLPGENPEDVVAELHHRADFESENARHLTALWRAPIVVTTAVAFFETLASARTSTLRRLHELPGSAIFIDESHAALPAHLLSIAWQWIHVYAREWNCYWLLASGSLSRFWTMKEIAQNDSGLKIPEIVSNDLRTRLSGYEKNRIKYRHDFMPKGISELANWITRFPGPHLVILNTVQSAAVVADSFREQFGRERVEHLSTALKPTDRENTLRHVRERLSNPNDTNWTLIATSCVEAGVDLSFRTGFRELCALVSLLQAAGRINREGRFDDCEIWTFCLAKSIRINQNPGIRYAADILRQYMEANIEITPELSTKSIEDELKLHGLSAKYKALIRDENNQSFPLVEQNFKVIDSNTRIAVVDHSLANTIRYGKTDWRELQKNSVQIAKYKLDEVRAPEILDGIYHWNLGYDTFIGYMSGIVKLKRLEENGMII